MIDGYYSVYPSGYVTVVNSLNNEIQDGGKYFKKILTLLPPPLFLPSFMAFEKFVIYDRKFTSRYARRSNLSDNHPTNRERERFNFERFEVEEGGKYPTRADRLITILNAIKHVKHGVALRTRNRNRVICSNLWEELFANSHRVSQ